MAVKTTTTMGVAIAVVVVIAIFSACLAMASPYWIQRRELSGNTVTNTGIWEICFLKHAIPKQYQNDKIYNGCYMFYGKAFANERSYFTPWWLIGCQVAMTMGFLGTILSGILLLVYFLCIAKKNYWHVLTALAIVLFPTGGLILGACITFGIYSVHFEGEVHSWVRWPHFMYFSWGFGFAVLASLFSFVGFVLAAVEAMHKKRNVDIWLRNSQMSMAMSEKSLISKSGKSATPSVISGAPSQPPAYSASRPASEASHPASEASHMPPERKISGASQPSLAPSNGRPAGGIRSSMGKAMSRSNKRRY